MCVGEDATSPSTFYVLLLQFPPYFNAPVFEGWKILISAMSAENPEDRPSADAICKVLKKYVNNASGRLDAEPVRVYLTRHLQRRKSRLQSADLIASALSFEPDEAEGKEADIKELNEEEGKAEGKEEGKEVDDQMESSNTLPNESKQ